MSKWQLPTAKNGEAFPDTIRSPVALRFEDVPAGSPLAHDLYLALQGPINHFYLKNAQAYALSPETHRRTHQMLPDATLEYTNNHGSEVLRVRVSPTLRDRVARQPRPHHPRDIVLVEFTIPSIHPTRTTWGAFVGPVRLDVEGNSPAVAKDHNGGIDFYAKPFLRYATDGDGQLGPPVPLIEAHTSGVIDQVSSLKIDLRPYHAQPSVTVDIYGYIDVYSAPSPTPTASAFGVILIPAGVFGPDASWFRTGAGISYSQAQWEGWFPELAAVTRAADSPTIPDPTTTVLSYWGSGISKKGEYDDTDGFTTWTNTTFYAPIYGMVPQYTSRVGTVDIGMFYGDQLDAVDYYYDSSGPLIYFRWRNAERGVPRLSRQPKPVNIATATPSDASAENHFGAPLLGHLICDMEHSVVTWKPV